VASTECWTWKNLDIRKARCLELAKLARLVIEEVSISTRLTRTNGKSSTSGELPPQMNKNGVIRLLHWKPKEKVRARAMEVPPYYRRETRTRRPGSWDFEKKCHKMNVNIQTNAHYTRQAPAGKGGNDEARCGIIAGRRGVRR
jgi:hypothetical protein